MGRVGEGRSLSRVEKSNETNTDVSVIDRSPVPSLQAPPDVTLLGVQRFTLTGVPCLWTATRTFLKSLNDRSTLVRNPTVVFLPRPVPVPPPPRHLCFRVVVDADSRRLLTEKGEGPMKSSGSVSVYRRSKGCPVLRSGSPPRPPTKTLYLVETPPPPWVGKWDRGWRGRARVEPHHLRRLSFS